MRESLVLFLPELVILAAALLVFGVSVYGGEAQGKVVTRGWLLALLGAVATVAASLVTLTKSGEPFFPGIYRVDFFSQVFKMGLSASLVLVLLLSRELGTVRESARLDILLFLLLSTLGMMALVSATELLTLYVSLEIAAYGLYAAVALRHDSSRGAEAAVKYVMLGIVASAVTLYGLSLIFGLSGTTYLTELAAAAKAGLPPLYWVALLLLFSAFLFKLAVFPLHFWVPDVYEGAPHQVVAFAATSSKLASIAILARVLVLVGQSERMFDVLAVISVISMTLGNLAAIRQRDLKRLLGYSAIAQGGYLMLGYCVLSPSGVSAALFYGFIYAVTTYLAFVVVCAVAQGNQNPTMESVAGLYRRSPALALMLMVSLFSLAGIPPTAGFVGKWFLFSAALERRQFMLVLVAAINGTVSLYYYLRVLRAAYLLPGGDLAAIRPKLTYQVGGYLAVAFVLIAGIYPQPLWLLARAAASLL